MTGENTSTSEEITITRALTELKLLDNRITKGVETIQPLAIVQENKKIGGYQEVKTFEDNAKSGFQSVQDLIKRKNKIKSAIVTSNAKTNVLIGDKSMIVADALAMKENIKYVKTLSLNLKKHLQSTTAQLARNTADLEAKVQKSVETMLGSDKEKMKPDEISASIEGIRTSFFKGQEWKLVDPLKVEEKIKAIDEEIISFESNVDFALSESNAITKITI